MKKRNNTGFTLIELLAVLLIIGVLASIGIPRYFRAVERGRMSEGLKSARSALEATGRACLRGNFPVLADLDVEFGGGLRYFTLGNPTGDCNGYEVTATRNAVECSTLSGYGACPPAGGTIEIDEDGVVTWGAGIPNSLRL